MTEWQQMSTCVCYAGYRKVIFHVVELAEFVYEGNVIHTCSKRHPHGIMFSTG